MKRPPQWWPILNLGRELCSDNSEAIVIIVDVSDIVFVSRDAIFFVYLKINQEMVIVVMEDVIDCFISGFKLTIEFNEFSIYDSF